MIVHSFKEKIEHALDRVDVKINGDRPWDIQVHNNNLYRRIALRGSLGVGEAYVDGWWDCYQLDELFTRLLAGRIQDQIVSNNLDSILGFIRAKLLNLQSLSRSFQVGHHHYNLGNDLYQKMLGPTMVYSCAYWKDANNLTEAQIAKLDLICRKLHLQPGMTLLDIGCGWGSLMKHAAENYGVSCVGLTISEEQAKLGQMLCSHLPVEFVLQDYRQFEGSFDRIVSVGMIEHVGYKNYRQFMKICSRLLKDDGLFLLHTIGNRYSVTYNELWIDKYIFPNGMLPSLCQLSKAVEHLFVIEDVHNFGQYYDPTLMAWLHNFKESWPELRDKYGDRFYRIWTYYLGSLAGSFRSRNIQLWQIVLSKHGVRGGYNSIR